MRLLWFLPLVATALAQTQTQTIGIFASATPSVTLPITVRSFHLPNARLQHALQIPFGVGCAMHRGSTRYVFILRFYSEEYPPAFSNLVDPIPALTGGESYTGPTSVAGATPCICTTVMYNLVAAWGRPTQFNSTIPEWALAKVFQSDWFDLQQAVNVGVTSASAAPAATSTPPPISKKNDNVSAIVGGVVGGAGFILILLTCIFGFLRYRQHKWEVNQPQESPFIQSRNPLQKSGAPYGPGGLPSPTRPRFDEKPRPLQTETALPDVLADEHRQGKPDYTFGGGPGYGYRGQLGPGEYVPLPNPGVAGVGAGGRGLAAPTRVPPKDGAANAAAGNLDREGIFREDFSASEGHGYRSSNDGDSRLFRNPNNGRGLHPPSAYPYPTPPVPAVVGRTGGGNVPAMGLGATQLPVERPDEDVHAYSTVGDASISLYPSDADHHSEAPPPFVGGFTVPLEKEEYRLPDRGYSSGYAAPGSGGSGGSGGNENRGGNGNGNGSPGLDADPFAANRRPAAFNRVFGDKLSPTTGNGNGNGRGGAPANSTAARGSGPIRRGGSPLFVRNPPVGPAARRGTGPGGTSQDMGFGRQHQAAVGAYSPRESNAFSDESSPTAVGFGGDVGGSARGEESPLPSAPFAGRSGFGTAR
ncbi:hypothetical protein FRC10_002282 [Ceratobasidium sp. 414]|nr:hypothetical protein FRC10_002282 [Ceratobasidium sp. 414]